jgi:hypothetical protein
MKLVVSTILATALISGVAASFVACGANEASGTTGKRVTLKTIAHGEGTAPFVTALGWTVTLKTARVNVASLYYFDGEPIFSMLLPKRAFAHPGHYVAGEALGEMLTPSAVDLLAPATALPNGTGVSGSIRSARFTFGQGADGHAVYVEGEAHDATTTIPFRAVADLADVLDSYDEPKVEGCTFTAADVRADGTVTVAIAPSIWFDQVDFTEVKSDLASSTIAFNGFTRGLRKGTAYLFSYRSP